MSVMDDLIKVLLFVAGVVLIIISVVTLVSEYVSLEKWAWFLIFGVILLILYWILYKRS